MKFRGELKFPEIDHPGVPVTFLIEGSQAELVLEGESLGRWSLYDVHARRLIANAFQIDLEGTEVTFVADDPIDFAYRGVEHMAETWAALKAKRIATRSIAVRKSRKGTVPSRIEDMKAAMESNLQAQSASRQIAGEVSMPDLTGDQREEEVSERVAEWDRRDEEASIPLVGPDSAERPDVAVPEPAEADEPAPTSEEARSLDEERRRLAEERARFEEERRDAEQREADRIEAYRLEMKRLEEEREELRRQASGLAGEPDSAEPTKEPTAEPEPETEPADELEPELDELDEEATPSGLESDRPETMPEPEAETGAEPEPEAEAEPEPAAEPEPEAEPEPVGPGVVDLKDLEEGVSPSLGEEVPPAAAAAAPSRVSRPAPQKEPEPALAGAGKDKGGLMGAVRAAFRSSARDHEHQFIEAPGGIGITRYVCEECGYVSISV